MWVLGIIAGLIAVPFVAGMFMPERYEGEVVVEFDEDVETVWDALQDVEAHPMTGKMMKSVEFKPDAESRPVWVEDMGRGELITVSTAALEAHRHMIRDMSSASVNMTSRWDYTLEPAGSGTRVTLKGVTDIKSGSWRAPPFRFMMVVGGGVKKGLEIQLDMVARTLGSTTRRV